MSRPRSFSIRASEARSRTTSSNATDRFEVSRGLPQEFARELGLAEKNVCTGEVVPDGTETISGRTQARKIVAQLDCVAVPPLRQESFELENPILGLVAHTARIGE